MMGGGPRKDKKFIGKLLKQLASGAKKLYVVDDKFGTPTYTVDFARNILTLIGTEYYGLYNMVCGGETGRLEVARELISILRLDDSVQVEAVKSDYFAADYSAPRPPSERLLNYKLDLRGLNHMREWQLALRDYIGEYYSDYVQPFAPDFGCSP